MIIHIDEETEAQSGKKGVTEGSRYMSLHSSHLQSHQTDESTYLCWKIRYMCYYVQFF